MMYPINSTEAGQNFVKKINHVLWRPVATIIQPLFGMGVKGLTSYLQRCGAYIVVDLREQNMNRRQNNPNDRLAIVVDGLSLLHFIKKKEITSLHPMSFKTFAENARSFLRHFLQQEIELIVVFDGVFEPIKNSTRTQRRADRWDLIKEALKLVSSNNVPRDPDSTSTMIYRLLLIQILNELAIRHMTVQGEADQFIAKYCKTNNHFAVMANDSDYFIMGVDFIMLNTVSFPADDQDRIVCQLYTKQKVIQVLNVSEDKLALFAGLMDNDYVEEKHLNNFYSYLKILKKNSFDTIKKVIQYVQNQYSEDELLKYLGKTPFENFSRAVSKFRLECDESEKPDVSAIDKCPKEIEGRFVNGEFMVTLLGILLQKENWLSVVPMMKTDVDIWRVILPLRKRMYGMMFGSDAVVVERGTGHKSKKVKSDVSTMNNGAQQVSHFSDYFTQQMSRQAKLEALLNTTTTCTTEMISLHEEIPPQLFLSVVCLRFLIEVRVDWTHVHDEPKNNSTENNNNNNNLNSSDSSSSMSTSREDITSSAYIKAFSERELDVLLHHLISTSRASDASTSDSHKHVTLPTSRGLHMSSLLFLCFQQMFLFNALLNNPFDFNQIKIENMFEGNQFHRTLRNAKYFDETVNDEDAQLHDKLKTVILSHLNKDVFNSRDASEVLVPLTMPTKLVMNGPPSLMTTVLNNYIKRLPAVQVVKHTARQIVLQTTNELTAKNIVQFDGVVMNGLALSVELQYKQQI